MLLVSFAIVCSLDKSIVLNKRQILLPIKITMDGDTFLLDD